MTVTKNHYCNCMKTVKMEGVAFITYFKSIAFNMPCPRHSGKTDDWPMMSQPADVFNKLFVCYQDLSEYVGSFKYLMKGHNSARFLIWSCLNETFLISPQLQVQKVYVLGFKVVGLSRYNFKLDSYMAVVEMGYELLELSLPVPPEEEHVIYKPLQHMGKSPGEVECLVDK